MFRLLCLGLLLLSFVVLPAQPIPKFKQYRIEFDSLQRKHFLVDTLSQTRLPIDAPGTQYPGRVRFRQGLIYASAGDMKTLWTLDGRKLLDLSHFIHFYPKEDQILAYLCGAHSWIYLNGRGDTLSFGRSLRSNYVPRLQGERTPACDWDPESQTLRWGYLDENARWIIPAQYDEAASFEGGSATVTFQGKRGKIDLQGNWIEPAQEEKPSD